MRVLKFKKRIEIDKTIGNIHIETFNYGRFDSNGKSKDWTELHCRYESNCECCPLSWEDRSYEGECNDCVVNQQEAEEPDDEIPVEVFEYLKAIPIFKDRGVIHTAPCPCGGTLTAVRSTYNGHLHVECDTCDFKLHE